MKNILYKIIFPFVNEKYNLENKWWHRLIKVIFIIIMILSLLILINNFNIIKKTENLFSYNYFSNTQALQKQKTGFSIIQHANASEEILYNDIDLQNAQTLKNMGIPQEKIMDLVRKKKIEREGNIIQTFLDDSKNKPELQSKRNAVIEMLKNQEEESFIQDTIVNKMGYTGFSKANTSEDFGQDDIVKFRDLLSKGIEPERAKKLIIQSKGITYQPIQQKNKLLLDLFLNITYILLSLYFINLILQIIYYKIILYIIYGKK